MSLYYTAPSTEQFDEVKREAIKLWQTYDNKYGYVTEKVDRIKDLQNIGDNFMTIIAMFDIFNQRKLAGGLSTETRNVIKDRMIEGGNNPALIVF